MAIKNNIRSIRFSDELMEIINDQVEITSTSGLNGWYITAICCCRKKSGSRGS